MINVVIDTLKPLFTLDEAKQHLGVGDPDNPAAYITEDALITTYAKAAVRSVLKNTMRDIVPQDAEDVFKVAALMVLSDLYNNRETIIEGQTRTISSAAACLLEDWQIIRV